MSIADLESEFIEKHVRPVKGRTLIVGSKVYKFRKDRRKVYPNSVGVDIEPGEGVDFVADLSDQGDMNKVLGKYGLFNHIECWSVLEHAKRPWLLAENLQHMLYPESSIHVQVPFVWRVHSYPSDYWRFTTEAIQFLFPRICWHALEYAHLRREPRGKVPIVVKDSHKYVARTEVYGFGILR